MTFFWQTRSNQPSLLLFVVFIQREQKHAKRRIIVQSRRNLAGQSFNAYLPFAIHQPIVNPETTSHQSAVLSGWMVWVSDGIWWEDEGQSGKTSDYWRGRQCSTSSNPWRSRRWSPWQPPAGYENVAYRRLGSLWWPWSLFPFLVIFS